MVCYTYIGRNCASNYMYCFMLHIHVYVFLLPPPLFSQVERLQRINDENAEKLESSELQINAVSNEYRNIIQQREVRVVTCRVGMGCGRRVLRVLWRAYCVVHCMCVFVMRIWMCVSCMYMYVVSCRAVCVFGGQL